MPRPRVRRARAFADVGLEVSLRPSAAFGMESLPPIFSVSEDLDASCGFYTCDVQRDAFRLVVELGDVKDCGLSKVASRFTIRASWCCCHVLAYLLPTFYRDLLHGPQHTITTIGDASAGVESGVHHR